MIPSHKLVQIVDFANILNVGKNAENFRGTAYESADNTYKKAVKWDGCGEFTGWLGLWEGYSVGADTIDHIRFNAEEGDRLIISGVDDKEWRLLDKNGNEIDQKILSDGEYILQIKSDNSDSLTYSVALA